MMTMIKDEDRMDWGG